MRGTGWCGFWSPCLYPCCSVYIWCQSAAFFVSLAVVRMSVSGVCHGEVRRFTDTKNKAMSVRQFVGGKGFSSRQNSKNIRTSERF